MLSAALVARWFQAQVQRCLCAVRARLQERCRVQLAVGAATCPLVLQIAPRSDYVCCHLSLTVHLTPAIPLGEGLLTPGRPPAFDSPPTGHFLDPQPLQSGAAFAGLAAGPTPGRLLPPEMFADPQGAEGAGRPCPGAPWAAQWDRVSPPTSSRQCFSGCSCVARGKFGRTGSWWPGWRTSSCSWCRLCSREAGPPVPGEPHLPEILSLPKFVKEASPVNLLADFERPALERVALQLLSFWKQASGSSGCMAPGTESSIPPEAPPLPLASLDFASPQNEG
ncbi:hypothetical protein E2320_012099 [Naja naja]|nr:hypothetical protein E2320_012099 [Naja naja]